MKICICGSWYFVDEAAEIKKKLEGLGHEVKSFPIVSKELVSKIKETKEFITELKDSFLRAHYQRIEWSDALLILNYERKGFQGYIGGATFAELMYAFYLNKKLFVINPFSRELPYIEELDAIKPIVINGDLTKIK